MICRSWSWIQCIHAFLNKVRSCDRKCHWYDNKCHWYLITMFITLYHIIYPIIKKSHSHLSLTIRFYFTLQFLKICVQIHLSPKVSKIYNLDQNLRVVSQIICDNMISDPKSNNNFHAFLLCTWVYFVSSQMWQLSTYFEDSKVLESTVSWLLIELNQNHQ